VVFDSDASSLAAGGLESPSGVAGCDLVTGASSDWRDVAGAGFRLPVLFALFSFATSRFVTSLRFALPSFALLSFARFSIALLFFDSSGGGNASTLGGDDFALGWAGA
jgi:hypothetical protein